jgi:hypothetical protein
LWSVVFQPCQQQQRTTQRHKYKYKAMALYLLSERPAPPCLLAFKLTHTVAIAPAPHAGREQAGSSSSRRGEGRRGKGAEARFALLCQCSLPAVGWLSLDLHSFRFCARRVLTCPGLPEPHRETVPQWRGIQQP